MTRKRRLSESDIVNRSARSDLEHWRALNYRCPTCYTRISDLTDDETYPHLTGECEKRLVLVGPEWVREGRYVDAPLADREEQDNRALSRAREVNGKQILGWSLAFLIAAVLILLGVLYDR
jgi:hypothetical protein